MRKLILDCFVFAFLVIVWSSFIVGVHSSTYGRHRRQLNGTTGEEGPSPAGGVTALGNNTTPSVVSNTTLTKSDPGATDQSDSVTVTVVIVILVVAVVAGVGVFIFLRIRKRRMADYDKKTQIQMSSTSNAGVYADLTSPAADKEKQADSPETEHLNKEEE